MMLNTNSTYKRIDNVIYDSNNIPILKMLLRKYLDYDFNTKSSIEYLNRYITLNPSQIEVFHTKPIDNQLELF